MKASRLNSRFVLRSALVLASVALLVFLVHTWQIRRHAAGQLALAAQAEQDDNADEFLAALNRYLIFDPANTEVRTRYALALTEKATTTRDRWRALQVLRQAMAETPDRSEVHLQAVEIALALKEPAQARKYLEPLLQAEPDRADLHLLAARCEQASNRPAAEAQSLSQALALAPAQVETAKSLAVLYRDRLGQPRLARDVLDRFVKANPRLPAAYLARARYALTDSRLENAAHDLEHATTLAPNAIEVVQARAEVELLRGQLDQARHSWKHAITLAPARIELYLGLAQTEQQRGQTAVAIDTLRQARQKAPERIDLLFGLADLLIDGGKITEASDLRSRLGTTAEGRSQFLAARLAQGERRWLDAINAFNAAISFSDVSRELTARAYFELSRCYDALGGRREEMQALQSAVRLSLDTRPRMALAERLVYERRFDEALPLLRQLTVPPASPPRLWLLLARALVETNRITPAPQRRWTDVDQAIERAGIDPALEGAVAILQADRFVLSEEIDRARTTLDKACKKHPDQPALYLALADLASRAGDAKQLKMALGQGDKVLKDRLDWLWLRIDRLSGDREERAYRELTQLESRAERLPTSHREKLDQHLVEVYLHLGHHDDVERLCAGLLSYRGNNAQVRLWLIESLLARNDLPKAQLQIAALRKLEGEDGLAWRCARAELLMRRVDRPDPSQRTEARRLLNEARKARPDWSHPVYLLARLDDREQHTDDALAGYRRVLDLGDYRPLALTRALEILDGKKQWGEAFAICERAIQKGVLDRRMQRVAANLAVKANQKSRARDLALLVVPEGNRVYRDQLWLGNILDAAAQQTAAREAFDKALHLAPDAIDPYLALIAYHVRHNRRGEAMEVLDQMRSTLDAERNALAVARAYEIMGQPDKAEQTYRKILEDQPRDPDALSRLAALLVRYNQPIRAEAILLRLFDHRVFIPDEDIPDLRRQLALVWTAPERKEDNVARALTLLDANRRQLGDTTTDQRVRTLVEGRRPDRRAAALKTLERLPGLLLPEEQLRLARLYDAGGNEPRARAILHEGIERDPVNTGTIAILIDTLLRHNHRVQAAEWIDRLEQLEPGSRQIDDFRRRMNRKQRNAGR